MIDLEKTIKFIDFFLIEIARYKDDWELTEDELFQFKIELKNFKKHIKRSNLFYSL